MDSSLAPFLNELFLSRKENYPEFKDLLPKVWTKYVDDIFTSAYKNKEKDMLEFENKAHQNIRWNWKIGKVSMLRFKNY